MVISIMVINTIKIKMMCMCVITVLYYVFKLEPTEYRTGVT